MEKSGRTSSVTGAQAPRVTPLGRRNAAAPGRQPPDLVQAVVRACELLKLFQDDRQVLRSVELARKAGLHKATASRLLRTLEHAGLLERVAGDRFRSRIRFSFERRHRIGFATRGMDTPFSRDVALGLHRAAEEAAVELVVLDSHRSPRAALRDAERLVREGVKLVVEFQSHERVAPLIAACFLRANIPVIAVEIPHPGAVFFGANNYQAGLIGGRALGKWIRQHWGDELDAVLQIVEERAGALVRLRVSGMLEGLREVVPQAGEAAQFQIDGAGNFERTFELVRRHLRLSPPQRTAVLACNDPSALGAIRAFEEAGRTESCAVMGQNASLEARNELRRRRTPLVGSVAYFPEHYGEAIIRLARLMLQGRPVPPAVYTRHVLITAENVDRYYPLDKLLPRPELASRTPPLRPG